ncbi:MAG: hypothetical protein JWN39_3712 [Ilumatobacteraceae bacterium]|nr:hypothetical protein [Ilumatobacteraceae bacterium]
MFLVRRAVLGAAMIGVIAAVAASVRSDTKDNHAAVGTGNVGSSGGDTLGTASPAAALPASEAPVVRTPTTSDPAHVLLVGDSDAGGLSPFLERGLEVDGLTVISTDYKVSSGFVRPDFFDWPAHLQATLPTANADIVVAVFGANDGQSFLDMPTKPVTSPEWRAEYGKRISAAMDLLGAGGRPVIWVGVPNGRDPSLTAALEVQNEVVTEQIAQHPKVTFVDTWRYFSGINGAFPTLVLDPRTGDYVATRKDSDGFHLNTVGEKILAAYVADALNAVLRDRGATTSPDETAFDVSTGGNYTVEAGDSLGKIAGLVDTSVSAIVAANGWTDDTQLIYPGMKIKVPGKEALS